MRTKISDPIYFVGVIKILLHMYDRSLCTTGNDYYMIMVDYIRTEFDLDKPIYLPTIVVAHSWKLKLWIL